MPYSVNPSTGELEYRDTAGSIGAITNIDVDAFLAPGTDPVTPDVGTNNITLTGGQVVSGTVGADVLRSYSGAAHTVEMQIQQSGSSAAQDTTLNGVSHFNSSDFTLANGFVSLNTVPISKGGTGQTSKTNAFDALAPTTTKGDLIVYNGTDNIRIAVGTDGQVLTADSSQTEGVRWQTNSGGDVTGPSTATDNALVRFDGTSGKLIQNSNAILTDAGNLSLATPLGVNSGGTGVGTLSGIAVGNGTTAFVGRTITGTANQITVTNGDGTAGNPTLSLPSTIQVGGISFDSGTNTLSHYSTGTFTPALSRTSLDITYSLQEGKYTRIGNRVFIYLALTVGTVTNAGTGPTLITGLPFTSAEASGFACIFQNFFNFPAGLHVLSAVMGVGSTNANVWLTGGATATSGTLTPGVGKQFVLMGHYGI